MFFKPKCSPETALDQAGATVAGFLDNATTMLENRFGKGFVKNNPELLGMLVQAQAYDFRTTVILDGNYEISEAIREIASRGL